jgi:hypothetical protein
VQGESSVEPAKERYDRKRPVVSFRVSREQLVKLEELIKGSGVTKGRFIRRALDLELKKMRRIHRKGYREGYEKAKKEYTMHACCKGCGDPIPLTTDMEQWIDIAAGEVLNVYHRDCRPRDLPEDACQLFDRVDAKKLHSEERKGHKASD